MPKDKQCLKCGHRRDLADGGDPLRCPSCEAVYSKVEAAVEAGEEIYRTGRFSPVSLQPEKPSTPGGQSSKPAPGKGQTKAPIPTEVQIAEIKSAVARIEALMLRREQKAPEALSIPASWIVALGSALVLFGLTLPMASAGKLFSGSVIMLTPLGGLILLGAAGAAWIGAAFYQEGRTAVVTGIVAGVGCVYSLHRIHQAIREMKAEVDAGSGDGFAGGIASFMETIAAPSLDVGWPLMVLASVVLVVGGLRVGKEARR